MIFTTEVIIYFISAVPGAFGTIFLFYQYFRLRYKHFIICALTYLSLTLWEVSKGLAILFFSFTYAILSVILWIPITFSVALLYDTMTRESVETGKMMLVSVLSTVLLFLCFDMKYYYIFFYPNGDPSIFIQDTLLSAVLGLVLVIMASVIYLGIKFQRNAPKELKNWIYLANVGIFFQQITAPLITALKVNQSFPAFSDIFFGLGTLLMGIVYAKQPKLGFLLPFKASRLVIIEQEKSIPLYYHVWNKKDFLIDENLFSGMISALGQFVKETIQKGNIKEIQLEESIVILKQSPSFPIVFVLLATKSSGSLRSALNLFADVFSRKYQTEIDQFKNNPDVNLFKDTPKVINECFPFIPYY
ncbi:MAG: hypothetical protein ACFFCM_11530 [Promethearchaeota archaeon]